MRLSRRVALATLSLVSAASLAACGGGSSSSSTASANDAGASSAATAGASGTVSGEITVFAAASLQDSFEEIAKDFKADNPDASVTFDFEGSQDLVSALAEGSAADVLATANSSTMKDAADQDLVGEQTEFATNALTLIVPKGNPAGITGLDSSLDHADLVICAPEVPCGAATVKLEKDLGVTLDPVSEEQKVTDVRGKVESGEADAGIVYATDAKDAGDAVETVALPANDVINHYPIAVTKDAKNAAAAQAFVDYVLSRSGQTVLQGTYGFGAPGAGADASRSASPATTK